MRQLWKGYLLMNPGLRGLAEWGISAAAGLLCIFTGSYKMVIFPVSLFIGAGLFTAGFIIHCISEKTHKQARERAKEINKIIDTGMYTKIRHPLYLTMIMMNMGIGIGFGFAVTIGLGIVLSFLTVCTAIEEERFLLKTFSAEYRDYMARVQWRMIPGIF